MTTLATREVLVHLALLDGIGPVTCTLLYERLGQEIANIYHFSASDFVQLFGMPAGRANALYHGLKDLSTLEHELDLIAQHGLAYVSLADSSYPALLRDIYAPPPVLFYKGAPLHTLGPLLALVGSRKTNAYGKAVIDNIVPCLGDRGFTIVSGGALGADGMAHEVCVSCKKPTVVVLGSGLLRLYPHSHKRLFERVCETGGTLVSGLSQTVDPAPGNFPARNRIIAGLSWGCIVVQAASKSGALITARFAMDQGREVYAIPGRIDDPLSAGCHALIAQGATLVQSVEDIVKPLAQVAGVTTAFREGQLHEGSVKMPLGNSEEVGECEQKILCAIAQGCATFDELLGHTGLDFLALQEYLLQLEMDGRVRQTFVGTWQMS